MKKGKYLLCLLLVAVLLTACHKPEAESVPYEDPADHVLTGPDLTVFDGLYRAKLPHGEDEETWLEITGYNDFILLEYHGLMGGSAYRFWAEEFWPTETTENSAFGQSATFSAMGLGTDYDTPPQNRCITLTEDGVVLNYDDSDAEHYARDDSWEGGHSDLETLRSYEVVPPELTGGEALVGTWGSWEGWEACSVTFAEDGGFSLFYKVPGKPVVAWEGIWGMNTVTGFAEFMAEQVGGGKMPRLMGWEWSIHDSGDLFVEDPEQVLFPQGQWFKPVREQFFTVMDAEKALKTP